MSDTTNIVQRMVPSSINMAIKNYVPILFMYIASFVLTAICSVGLFYVMILLNEKTDTNFVFEDIFKSGFFIKKFPIFFSGYNLFFMFILLLLIVLIFTWFYNFCFILINNYVLHHKMMFENSFRESFSKNLFKVYLVSLIQFLAILLLVFVASFLGAFAFEVGKPFGIFYTIMIGSIAIGISVRFLLVNTTALFTETSIIDCFKDSFEKIDAGATIRYFFFALLGVVLYIVFLYAALRLQFYFFYLGTFGIYLNFFLRILFAAFLSAYIVSLLLNVFYKHNPQFLKKQTSSIAIEENLID